MPSPSRSMGSMCAGFDSRAISTNVGCSSYGLAVYTMPLRMSLKHHLEPSVVVQIDQPDVRHRRAGRTVRRRHHPFPERQRLIRGWPPVWRGEMLGRVRHVKPHDRLPVRGQSHHPRRSARWTARLRLVAPDQKHPGNFITPVASRQYVGRRQLVTRHALDMRRDVTRDDLTVSGCRRLGGQGRSRRCGCGPSRSVTETGCARDADSQ